MKILITGAGSGLGNELVKKLYKEHTLFAITKSKIKLKKLKKHYPELNSYQCDVSNENSVKKLTKKINIKTSYIDVIINNAGVYGEISPFFVGNFNNWKKAIEINLFGTYLVSKFFIKFLLKSKIKKIINVAGGGAFNPFPNFSSYACSKAATVRFSETIAEELKIFKIKVNCLAPGFIKTRMHNKTLTAGEKKAGKNFYNFTKKKLSKGFVPISRPIECIKFLISKKSKNLSGKTISASFDKWDTKKYQKNINQINKSDLFTLRRINKK